jgi:hydrogenase assembly chaperone HypC/HupF
MCFDTVGQVLTTARGEARVAFEGTERTISLVLLETDGIAVQPGDWVRSHTGLAVERLDAAAAQAEIAAARAMQESEDAS